MVDNIQRDAFDEFFRFSSVEHSLTVLDESQTTFKSEHKFVFEVRKATRFYKRRYKWTGSGDDDTPELKTKHDKWGHPIQKIHGPIIRENSYRILLVDLGETKQKGDKVDIHFLHTMRDLNKKFEKYIGCNPVPGTQKITLSATIPAVIANDVWLLELSADTGKTEHMTSLTAESESKWGKIFSFTISNNIKYNRSYRIFWGNAAGKELP